MVCLWHLTTVKHGLVNLAQLNIYHVNNNIDEKNFSMLFAIVSSKAGTDFSSGRLLSFCRGFPTLSLRGAKSEEKTGLSAFYPREKWGRAKIRRRGLLSPHFSRGQNAEGPVSSSLFAPRKRLLRRLYTQWKTSVLNSLTRANTRNVLI